MSLDAMTVPMLTSSYIFLRSLRFHAYHGVMEQERVVGNDYTLDVRIGYDVSKAMTTDSVDDTINYATVYQLAKSQMDNPSHLLEHVIGRIGKAIMSRFPLVETLDLRLTKLNPPMGADCDGAGVEIHLTREPDSEEMSSKL